MSRAPVPLTYRFKVAKMMGELRFEPADRVSTGYLMKAENGTYAHSLRANADIADRFLVIRRKGEIVDAGRIAPDALNGGPDVFFHGLRESYNRVAHKIGTDTQSAIQAGFLHPGDIVEIVETDPGLAETHTSTSGLEPQIVATRSP